MEGQDIRNRKLMIF